ncbi:fibroblast growth factor receptor 3, partial [Plakobranchus ocellatus]
KPKNPSCTVRENTAVPGDIESVTVSCSTTKVYPEAKCSFERTTNGGASVTINKTPTYNPTALTGTPVYYRSECSVDVPVAELGEGTHSFSAFIYPDVTDGINLVTATTASTTVTLTLPEASYTCTPEMIQGYFNGKSARCTCSLTSDGYPKGQAQWYRGSQTVPGVPGGVLDLTFSGSSPVEIGICKGVSAIGESPGSTLTAQFAFFEQDTVELTSADDNSTFDLCDDNNQIPVTCAVLKGNVIPAPTFSFSQTNVLFDNLQERQVGSYYKNQIDLRPVYGGIHQVICTVTNTIISETQRKEISLTFRKPPPLPPKITITGETYQDVNALNRLTLAAGYTGDMTCRVEGGYPKAHTTQLTCGSLTASGGENVATLKFQAGQLTKDMDGTECRCTSQHATGCYNDKETSLTLDVNYAPVVTFTHDYGLSQFNVGDTPTFTCTAQGNPPPSLTITRKRTDQQLAGVQRNLKTTELTKIMEPLDCLNTDVYVCTGQNIQGVTTIENNVVVKCPQQLALNINQPEAVKVVLAETAKVGVEIYGYPTPHLLTLMRTRYNTNLTGSARHLIEYSPGQAPFGFVNVIISDVVEEDFTNYTIAVDNGVGDPLVYTFYLVEEKQEEQKDDSDDDDTVATAVGATVAAVVVLVIAVIVVVLVKRYRASRKSKAFTSSREANYTDVFPDPADGYEMPVTENEGEASRKPKAFTPSSEVNYIDIFPDPADGYEMPVNECEEEGMQPEASAPPLSPSDISLEQPYESYSSPQQQGNNDTDNNSYSHLSFGIGEEKSVYANKAGHGTGEEKSVYANKAYNDTGEGKSVYANRAGHDIGEEKSVYANKAYNDTGEGKSVYVNTAGHDIGGEKSVYVNTTGHVN